MFIFSSSISWSSLHDKTPGTPGDDSGTLEGNRCRRAEGLFRCFGIYHYHLEIKVHTISKRVKINRTHFSQCLRAFYDFRVLGVRERRQFWAITCTLEPT